MWKSRRVGCAAAMVVAGWVGGRAGAAEPTQQELLDEIRALQAKVERLEAASQPRQDQAPQLAQTQKSPTTSQTQAAGGGRDATVDSVLRDADSRSNPALMAEEGFTAGYHNGKFLIQDAAGNFVLNPNIQFQARYVFNDRQASTADPDDSDENVQDGFEIRRLKFAFDGNAFGKALTYQFKWATNRANGTPLLEDAWARWAMGETFGDASKSWALRVGQFKDPTFHEEITSSKRQLAVERTLLNEVLAGGLTDFIQGVTFIWDDGPKGSPLRAEIGYSDGPNTDNTNFQNGGGLPASFPGLGAPNYGAFGRVELLAGGDWKQYDDFTAMGNKGSMFVLGAGASYAEFGQGDVLFHTADAQWENQKLGLYAAYVGLYSEPQGGSVTGGGVYDWGFLVQAGYMLNEKWEVFGRYDQTFLDENRLADGAEDTFPEITVGVNYYIKGHAAKLTLDGLWLPNGAPSNENGAGVLDPDGDDTQFAVRAQFQLLL
jgi:hypothetical protein